MKILFVIILVVALGIGWVVNVVKFVKSDFEAPYKSEMLRGVGIFVAPMGSIVGYLNIKD